METETDEAMSSTARDEVDAAPGSAYIALIAGFVALAVLPIPMLAFALAIVGIAGALHARAAIRRDRLKRGIIPSLLGGIFSVIVLFWFVPSTISTVISVLMR
jgi:hypothetical protein